MPMLGMRWVPCPRRLAGNVLELSLLAAAQHFMAGGAYGLDHLENALADAAFANLLLENPQANLRLGVDPASQAYHVPATT
jgi:hypothetical protein